MCILISLYLNYYRNIILAALDFCILNRTLIDKVLCVANQQSNLPLRHQRQRQQTELKKFYLFYLNFKLITADLKLPSILALMNT